MRSSLVLAGMLLARTAFAQPGNTPPQPAAPPESTTPAAPGDEPPKADPAYSEGKDTPPVAGDRSTIPGLRRGRDIVVRFTPDRTRDNYIKLGALAGASVLVGAVGLYFHLESQSQSDEVSANVYRGRAWTPDKQATYDDAHTNATIATVLYGVGGALLLSTAVYYIVTEPETEERVIRPHVNRPSAMLAPTRGGAFVGGTWRF